MAEQNENQRNTPDEFVVNYKNIPCVAKKTHYTIEELNELRLGALDLTEFLPKPKKLIKGTGLLDKSYFQQK